MSKFSLGGVPSWADKAFYLLRDATKTLAPDSQKWAQAAETLFELEDPDEAIRLLSQGKKRAKPRELYYGGSVVDPL